MKQITEALNWRYATKKYDTTKKVSAENIEKLKESIQLSASSFGLQPYRIIVVEDEIIRAKLIGASFNQTQITDASHLFVFTIENTVDDAYVDAYFDNLSKTRDLKIEGDILNYKGFVSGSMNRFTAEQKKAWATNQAYLALGNLLFTAALLEIDATPMEGFMASKYDEILGLNEKGIRSVVIAAVGYRHKEDFFQHFKKVRKPAEDLFETI
jgi:nitroreductase